MSWVVFAPALKSRLPFRLITPEKRGGLNGSAQHLLDPSTRRSSQGESRPRGLIQQNTTLYKSLSGRLSTRRIWLPALPQSRKQPSSTDDSAAAARCGPWAGSGRGGDG